MPTVKFDNDDLEVTITRSAGADGALLVIIDTTFEPDGSDGKGGLRVLLNDEPIFNEIPWKPVPEELDPGTELSTCESCGGDIIRFAGGVWYHRASGSAGWVDNPNDGAHRAIPTHRSQDTPGLGGTPEPP